MSEIEKMYENAGVDYEERYNNCTLNKEGECKLKCSCDICEYSEEKYIYPPFTAEKQIELIKWLKDNRDFHTCGNWCTSLDSTGETIEHRDGKFEEALAGLINQLFTAQDLTEEEKQQVKGILE